MRVPRSLVAGLLAALLASGWGCAAPDTRPNVVVIVLDTLRPDHLGFYGYSHETAPFLAQLAARGSVLERAWSTSSWTVPSTASIFTGLYPTRHAVIDGLFALQERQAEVLREGGATLSVSRIPPDVVTLPELFQNAGYRTFGIGANHNIGAGFGFRRGFDRFERLTGEDKSAAAVLATLSEWATEIRSAAPSFLYLHLNDPHLPYRPREGFLRGSGGNEVSQARRAYDSEIGYADHHLAQIAEQLGWGTETIVVLLSDHGEGFDDHGYRGHRPLSLYSDLNRVLFVVTAPAQGVRAQVLRDNASLVDLLPTLLDLAGITAPPELDGSSLAPLLRDDDGASALRKKLARRPLLAHRLEWTGERHLWSVIRGPWRWIALQDAGPAGEELYHLDFDPGEKSNRASELPDLTSDLRGVLATERARARDGSPLEVTIDAGDLEALRELGYVE